jgi:hypothetical protein
MPAFGNSREDAGRTYPPSPTLSFSMNRRLLYPYLVIAILVVVLLLFG